MPASHDTAPTWGHAGKDGAYPRGVSENQVLADQLANEATVEAIVRKRTLEGESSIRPPPRPSDCSAAPPTPLLEGRRAAN